MGNIVIVRLNVETYIQSNELKFKIGGNNISKHALRCTL
jgi:hypothetical protein